MEAIHRRHRPGQEPGTGSQEPAAGSLEPTAGAAGQAASALCYARQKLIAVAALTLILPPQGARCEETSCADLQP